MRAAVPLLLGGVGLLLLLRSATFAGCWLVDREKPPAARHALPLARRLPLAEDTPRATLWAIEGARAALGLLLLGGASLLVRRHRRAERLALAACALTGACLLAEILLLLLVEQPALATLARPDEAAALRAVIVTRLSAMLGAGLVVLLAGVVLVGEG